jgi:hypothetical protein
MKAKDVIVAVFFFGVQLLHGNVRIADVTNAGIFMELHKVAESARR